ncbi:MAG: hypothetical protein GY717_18705 [Rhodobacteraceae bacterium]|nr:hypothetical protein [Paracoccaceae bacterium]
MWASPRTAWLLAALPTVASAGGDWLKFTFEGRLSAGYSGRASGADAFLTGDATLRFAPDWLGPVGAELGVYGRADALDTPHETYGTLTWDFSDAARLSVGVPRPAFDGFAVSALEAGFPALAIDITNQTRSAATFGAMFANWLPYGVSLAGDTDRLRYAVSVHSAAAPGATVAGLGLGTEIGDWQLSGAVELTDGEFSAKTQAVRSFGAVEAGIGYYAPGAAGASHLAEAFATFAVSDQLSLGAVVQLPVDGGSATGGVRARYEIGDSLAVSTGIATDAGAAPMLNAFLDWQF